MSGDKNVLEFDSSSESIIEGPKLLPWQPVQHIRCAACGADVNAWDRICSLLLNRTSSVVNIGFCEGGKPLSNPLPPIQQMMSGREEIRHACAGIFEPHLHATCRRCGRQSLIRTKEATR